MEEDILVRKENNLNTIGIEDNNQITSKEEKVIISKEPKKGNGFIIVLLIMIIIGLFAYVSYDKFFKKDDNGEKDTSTPTSTPEITSSPTPSNNSQETDKKIIISESEEYILSVKEKTTYKTRGNDVLILVPGSDEEVKKVISKYEQYDEDEVYAYYNGKLINLEVAYKNGKYIMISGDDLGIAGQCSMYSFILNEETKELLDFGDYVIKINDKYYMIESQCIYGEYAVYTEDKELIGIRYLGHDDKYFYILNNNIVRYNANGNIVAKSNEVYKASKEDNGESEALAYDSLLYNGKLYVLINNKEDIYLVDTSLFKAIKVGTTDKYYFDRYADIHCLEENNGKIVILLQDKETNQNVTFTYNHSTGELKKK